MRAGQEALRLACRATRRIRAFRKDLYFRLKVLAVEVPSLPRGRRLSHHG